jgi:hypothetical protein
MADKRVVDAVRVTADHATCPCGEVIALADPDDPPPTLRGGKTVYLPQLVGIECRKCGAEVRLDRRDFTLREN